MIAGQQNVREKVFVQVNSTDLIAGQTLQFSCFVSSLKTGKISDLSKILYVELLNSENKPVHQTKIPLENGRGHGEYFLPTLINTGSYHLIAYTRWMKNFKDYFHQPIVVINPYEEIDFTKYQTSKSNVSFYPESGHIVAETENLIVVEKKGKEKKGIVGRIVTNENEQVAEFITNDLGFGNFKIKPKKGTQYRLILEENEDFQFYDLPITCIDCVGMTITQDINLMKISISNPAAKFNQGVVTITGPDGPYYSTPIGLIGEVLVPKRSIPKGVFHVSIHSQNEILTERLYWNMTESLIIEEADLNFNREQDVSLSFEMAVPSTMSIAVNKVYSQSISNDLSLEKYFYSRLKNQLFNAEVDQLNSEDLNALLIADEWVAVPPNKDSFELLPEYRADFMEGYITDLNDKPVNNLHLGLSIPGNNYQIQFARPDENGRFLLSFDSEVDHSSAVIKILNDSTDFVFTPANISESEGSAIANLPKLDLKDYSVLELPEGYRIYSRNEFYSSYSDLTEIKVQLDSSRVSEIIERSIFNQLENAYLNDSLQVETYWKQEQLPGFNSYVLDDFTRFQTMRDTFIEIIPEVGISRNENKYSFNMRTLDETEQRKISAETILLLDGVFTKAKDLIDLSPFLIKRIDVLSKKYVFGDKVFDGIISFHSLNDDLWKNIDGTTLDLTRTPMTPVFDHSNLTKDKRLPDFRDLLWWQPEVTSENSIELKFKTSKVPGLYEVNIDGISIEGEPISINRKFQVN